MAKSSSLNQFHKILNFLILILCIVVFGLMLRLLRNEYFNSSKNIMTETFQNNNNTNNLNNVNINNMNMNNMNMNNMNIEEVVNNLNLNQDNMFDLVLPTDPSSTEMTESNLNDSYITNGVIENGNIKVPEVTFNGLNNSEFKINDNKISVMVEINNNNNIQNIIVEEEDPSLKINMTNKVKNFLNYPDQQKYCPNIDDSESSFWAQLPEDYAGAGEKNMHLAKFCCTSCFYLISEEIYCGENQTGQYILDNFSVDDIAVLKDVYDELTGNEEDNTGNITKSVTATNSNEDFKFPESKLNSLLGKPALKYLYNDKYYTIQIVKTMDELHDHEDKPTIMTELYKRHYKCSAVATKPVATILTA